MTDRAAEPYSAEEIAEKRARATTHAAITGETWLGYERWLATVRERDAEIERLREKNQELNRRAQEEYSRGVKDCASKRSAGRSIMQSRAEAAEQNYQVLLDAQMEEIALRQAAERRVEELRSLLGKCIPWLEKVAGADPWECVCSPRGPCAAHADGARAGNVLAAVRAHLDGAKPNEEVMPDAIRRGPPAGQNAVTGGDASEQRAKPRLHADDQRIGTKVPLRWLWDGGYR